MYCIHQTATEKVHLKEIRITQINERQIMLEALSNAMYVKLAYLSTVQLTKT